MGRTLTTKFGRLAASDPRFVNDLRNGRVPGARMSARVEGFMAAYGAKAGEDRDAR